MSLAGRLLWMEAQMMDPSNPRASGDESSTMFGTEGETDRGGGWSCSNDTTVFNGREERVCEAVKTVV